MCVAALPQAEEERSGGADSRFRSAPASPNRAGCMILTAPAFLAPTSAMRAEIAAVLRIAVPLAAANLLGMAIYAIDVIFVAMLGTEALAAVTLSTSLYGLALWSMMSMVGAVAPLAASAIGRRRNALRDVRRTVRMGLWIAVMAGAFVMAVMLVAEPLMRATGQSPEVTRLAGAYLSVLAFAAIPTILASTLRVFVSTLDRAAIATAITVLALFVNALGNWLLIFGNWGFPEMGIEGAALASVITVCIQLIAYVVVIQSSRQMRRYYLFGRLWRPDWERFVEIFKIGLPIAAITCAEGGLFGAAAFLMGALGEIELAAHALAIQLAATGFQVPMGIAQGATIRVGLHDGADDRPGIGRAGRASLMLMAGFALAMATIMVGAPRLLLSIYVDTSDPANAALVGFAVSYVAVAAAFQLFDGAQAVLAGLLRGLSDTRVPLLIALFGYWPCGFGTAWLLAFVLGWGGLGVWIGLAVGLVVTSALMAWRWTWRDRLGLRTPRLGNSP